MIFRLLYSTALMGLSLFWLPKLFQTKSRKSLSARFGINVPALASLSPHRIWVHAVSVGESKAVFPLVRRLKKDYPEAFIIFSTTTLTGLEEVERSCLEVDRKLLLPFDFLIRKFVQEAKPTLVILSETDFWYNFLDEAKKQGAKIVLVNGKLSSRSQFFYGLFPQIFSLLDKFIVQGEIYQERFLEAHVPPEKIIIGGNLKIHGDTAIESPHEAGPPVLVIGSTHDPEEKFFLEALNSLWECYPTLTAYLVPRHPERFDAIAGLIETYNIPYQRSSKGDKISSRLVLVDEMGRLKSLYQEADICVVAGSWTEKVGGHNIMEPSFFAKPVIFGPYMQNQPDFEEQMLEAEAGVQVRENDIVSAIDYFLQNPYQARLMGLKGLELVRHNQGALETTYTAILDASKDFEDVKVDSK